MALNAVVTSAVLALSLVLHTRAEGMRTLQQAPTSPVYNALSTYFSGCGQPYCGCGVPQSMLTDDFGRPYGFLALNSELLGGGVGQFNRGKNCGRFIKITVGNGCSRGSNLPWKICVTGGKSGLSNYDPYPDAIARSKKVLYAMVVDSCGDPNYWCKTDKYHVDISMKYLISQFGSIALWRNRKVSWQWVSGPPAQWSMKKLKFAWGEKASLKLYYLPLVIANTPNGMASLEVLMTYGWVRGEMNGYLGNQWKVPNQAYKSKFKYLAGGLIQVRITSFSGSRAAPYGTYAFPLPSGSTATWKAITNARRIY